MDKTFSIVLIAFNNPKSLLLTLHSLNSLNYSRELFEVIVVDDGSIPSLKEQLDLDFNYPLQFHYITRTNRSCRSKARNQGAQLAQFEFLIFIDGDQYVNKDLLRVYNESLSTTSAIKCLLGTRVNLTQWQTDLLNDSRQIDKVEKITQKIRDTRLLIKEGSHEPFPQLAGVWTLFWSHNFAIERNLFESLNGFDENFIHWGFEDVDFGYRLMKSNNFFDLVENNVYDLYEPSKYDQKKMYLWLKNIEFLYNKHNDIGIMYQLELYDSYCGSDRPQSDQAITFMRSFKKLSGKIEQLEECRVLFP